MQIGDIVVGKITGIKDYGAFVQVGKYSGLIHISEFSNDFVKDINNIVAVGDLVSVLIVEMDEDKKRLKLSYKQANVMPSKLLEKVHIFKGFNALEIHLDRWIDEEYEEIMKGKNKNESN